MKNILSALLLTCAFVLPAMAAPDFEETKELAEQGDAVGQYNLGFMYDNGEGAPENDAEAVKWYRLAAGQGDAIAQFNLALMYRRGEGVPQNDAEAVKWYRLAADQGHADAQYNLGLMYAKGEGVPQNDTKAYALMSLAVTQVRGVAKGKLDIVKGLLPPEQLAEGQRLAAECYERDYKGCGF